MASDSNAKMNSLIRQNAPETASDPMGKPADDAGNQWFRSSVRDAQDERLASVWIRMMRAHMKELEWEEKLKGDNNG